MFSFGQSLVALLMLLVLLAACGTGATPAVPGGSSGAQPQPGPTETSPTQAPAPQALDGTSWTLVALRGQPPLESSSITLKFSGDSAGGSSGCNQYGGQYRASAAGELELRDVAMTLMACQAQGIMDQEQAFMGALQQVAAYRLQGDQLELSSAGGEVLLVFTRQQRQAQNPAGLERTSWVLRSYDGQPPLAGSQITIAFAGGTASGSAGCRHYSASYQARDDELSFPSIEMQEPSCDKPQPFHEQEGRFTDALTFASHYRLDGGQLILVTSRGEELVFEPLPQEASVSNTPAVWVLQSFVEQELAAAPVAGTELTLSFDGGTIQREGQLSGSAGCNRYSARYRYDGSVLSVESAIATRMACPEPAGAMEQEQRYLQALQAVRSVELAGGELRLVGDNGLALVFGPPKGR